MNDAQHADIAAWITQAGLGGWPTTKILAGFCRRLAATGFPVIMGQVVMDTLHPTHEGHAAIWRHDQEETVLREYGRSDQGEAALSWQRSPFYHLFTSGEPMLRRRLTPEAIEEFPHLASAHNDGCTEYVGILNRFGATGVVGEMDCVYSAWATTQPEGFDDGHIADLHHLLPLLALALKCTSLADIAATLVETYLGRDAGRLVLGGRINRGVADRIDAALWFSDLRGYTTITDTAPPEQLIPLLNDYAEAVISAVHAKGGDVLKLIGDGVLAIFRAEDRGTACRMAIDAATAAERNITTLNERRAAEGAPTTHIYLGLHLGEVFFGNVGSADRLDFTVVGPAVNEASRIAAMCRSADRTILVSAAFATALGDTGPQLVSVGRYALRGVGQAQELFTIDPGQTHTA